MTRGANQTGRSKGPPRHVRVFFYMLESPAWRELSATERAVYLELLKRFNGSNNGRIVLSIREAAEELKIAKSTASEALKRLCVMGFIAVSRKGFFSGCHKVATEYRLTEHPCNVTGEPATKEFARIGRSENFPVRPQVLTVRPEGQVSSVAGTGEVLKRRFST